MTLLRSLDPLRQKWSEPPVTGHNLLGKCDNFTRLLNFLCSLFLIPRVSAGCNKHRNIVSMENSAQHQRET